MLFEEHKIRAGVMKATEGFHQVFLATIVLGLNGYFVANAYGNEGIHTISTTLYYFRSHL